MFTHINRNKTIFIEFFLFFFGFFKNGLNFFQVCSLEENFSGTGIQDSVFTVA